MRNYYDIATHSLVPELVRKMAMSVPGYYLNHGNTIMNAIQAFQFQSKQLRVEVDEHGNPWFCGKDVCDILGYTNHNKTLKDHCNPKGVTNCYPLQTAGGVQYPAFINEGNLYRLIIKSNKPESAPFESWVFDEVLTSIRKHGGYLSAAQGPMTLEQFHDRQLAIEAAKNDLLSVQVTLSGAELLALKITPAFMEELRSPTAAKQKVSALIIQMAKDGNTRAEIAARLDLSRNNVRQQLFNARRDGFLSSDEGLL